MYICVDFDGTIVDHVFPRIGQPVPGAIKWMKRWGELGAKIILYTMRSDRGDGETYLKDAVQYLEGNGVELYGANINHTQARWSDSPKVYGHVYVDDAAYGCPMHHPEGFSRPCVNWDVVGPAIELKLLEKQ